jgi:hypothetical protein
MTPKMELKQVKNEKILSFVRNHTNDELFERLSVICNDIKQKSRLSKFYYIQEVLKERVRSGALEYNLFRQKIDVLRLKF